MIEFFSYCRLQTGCLVFLLYIGFLMVKGSEKDSNRNIFSDLLYCCGELCVVFDAITAWSVNKVGYVSMTANYVFHGIFYVLLEAELWFMYFYFRSIVNRLPKSLAEKILFIVLALGIAIATLVTMPQVKIVEGKTTNYSYGTPVFIVFSLVPVFLFFIAVFGGGYVRRADPVKKLTFSSCFVAVTFFTVLQLVFPESLVTSLNVSLMITAVALNNENPMFHKLERVMRKYEMEKNYYDRLDEIEQKQAIIRHDEKHYLAAIGGLCAEGKTEEIEKLLKVMNIELQKNTPRKYVRNRIANALLNEKENFAIKQNVRINYQVEPEVDLDAFEEIDIIAMFGNLIDNAVRAEKEWQESHGILPENSEVSIKLFETEGNFIMLVVENHFSRVDIKNGKLVSTKELPSEHGIGLFNVRLLCEKYGGIFDMDMDEDIFISSICLPKEKI
ncbi:GHKL domain-containing protein [Treponema sp.]|uniref:sensor histidine kinase n=1 Tax=Treponema sp. TaxID=166 RepID=UPI00388D681E